MDISSHTKVLTAVFIIMLLLMVVPIAIGINRINEGQYRLQAITGNHNVKTTLSNEIRDLIRQRQTAVRNVLLIDDLFKKDDELNAMDHLTFVAQKKMSILKSMLMTQEEIGAFKTLENAAYIAYPVQQELVDRSFSGENIDNLSDLLRHALTTQNQVLLALDNFIAIQEKATTAAVANANQSHHSTILYMVVIGVIELLLGVSIAARVLKFTRSQAIIIQSSMNDLEEKVESRTIKLKSAYDLALASNNAKSSFLANMSHELRTPLNAIIGYGELMLDNVSSNSESDNKKDLNRIIKSGKHLLSIIDDVLQLSKLESGRINLIPSEVSLFSVIEDVRRKSGSLIEKNNNYFSVKVYSDPLLFIDESLLKLVITNILNNAAKYTTDGTVEMLVDSSSDVFTISISDTGIGLSKDSIDKIFDGFNQADISSTRKYDGTGLGLTISKRLCDLMGGFITVESTLEVGSTFTIELPVRMNTPNNVYSLPNVVAS